MQQLPVPGQEPGTSESIVPPAGEVVAGTSGAGSPGADAAAAGGTPPPIPFSDLKSDVPTEAPAPVEAAATAPAVPGTTGIEEPGVQVPVATPSTEGLPTVSDQTVPVQQSHEVPADNAQDSAEAARAATTEHLHDELEQVGQASLSGETAVPAPPPEITGESGTIPPAGEVQGAPVATPADTVPLPPPPQADVPPSTPPVEPPQEPATPAEVAPTTQETLDEEKARLLERANELSQLAQHNSTEMLDIMRRLREITANKTTPASSVESGSGRGQVG